MHIYLIRKKIIFQSHALITLLLVTVIAGSFSSNVYSHASPVSYSPAINSNIVQNGSLPTKVVISFSEGQNQKQVIYM